SMTGFRFVSPSWRAGDLTLGSSRLSRRARRRWCSLSGPPETSTRSWAGPAASPVSDSAGARREMSRLGAPPNRDLIQSPRLIRRLLHWNRRQVRPGGGLLSRLWTQGLPSLRTMGTLAMYVWHHSSAAKHRGTDG